MTGFYMTATLGLGLVNLKHNIWRKKLHREDQGCKFQRVSFNDRNNVRTARRERQSQKLKRWLFIK